MLISYTIKKYYLIGNGFIYKINYKYNNAQKKIELFKL